MTSETTTASPDVLALLRQVIAGERLDAHTSAELFSALSRGELSPVRTAALLGAMHARGETPQEIAGAAQAFRAAAREFPALTGTPAAHLTSAATAEPATPVCEIVGTGGDGVGTINISTAAALTCASLGLRVAKHGNRAVSSTTGAADVVGALGLPLDRTPEQAAQDLERDGFTFLFAQAYHPAMRFVAPVRAELAAPTIFNLLGPLINPAPVTHQLMGVANPALLDMIAQAMVELGRERALVVHGEGLDEMAVHGVTQVREVSGSQVRTYELTPEELGLPRYELADLVGGEPQENARLLTEVFAGGGVPAQRDAIALNAGAMLYLTGHAQTLRDGVQVAREHLLSGAVAAHCQTIRERLAAQSAPAAASEKEQA